MTRDELLTTLSDKYKMADVSKVNGFLAIQVNLTDTEPSVFYIEVKDGKLSIQPYEYNDRQALIKISSTNMLKLVEGTLDPVKAFLTGKIKVNGDTGKALELKNIVVK